MNNDRKKIHTPIWKQSWFWTISITLAGAIFLFWLKQPDLEDELLDPARILAEEQKINEIISTFLFPLPEDPSIAILSFSGTEESGLSPLQAHAFSREVVSALHKHDDLFVIHYDSSKHLTASSPIEVGMELGINYVLSGDIIAIRGNKTQVNLELFNTISQEMIWEDKVISEKDFVNKLPIIIAELVASNLQTETNENSEELIEDSRDFNSIPQDAWILYLLGRDQAASGTIQSNKNAEQFFSNALNILPNFTDALIELGFTKYYTQQGFEGDLTGKTMPELQSEILIAIDQSPENPRGYELMSRLKMLDYTYFRPGRGERNNREQAMDYLAQAVELSPGDPDLMIYRAQLHTKCCRRSSRSYYAQEYAEDAIRLHPKRDWIYDLTLAQTLQLQMVYDQSISIIEKLIIDNPNILRLHREAALVHGLMRNVEEGEFHMSKILNINPSYGAGWESEDSTYDQRGNFQRDMEALRRVGLP